MHTDLVVFLTVSNETDPRKIFIWRETLPWELLDMFLQLLDYFEIKPPTPTESQ